MFREFRLSLVLSLFILVPSFLRLSPFYFSSLPLFHLVL